MKRPLTVSRPVPAARLVVALASLALLAAPALVVPTAEAGTASGGIAAAEVKCAEGTAERKGAWAHDGAHSGSTVTAAVKERVAREVAVETGRLNARAARSGSAPLPARITVPVRIHIIHGKHKSDRKVTRKDARKLLGQLRAGFNGAQNPAMAPTGIGFDLRKITVNRDDRWFHAAPGSKADRQMHRRLHQGSRRSLNIYLNGINFAGGSLLGVARFPWMAGARPLLDGVTINVATLSGGRARGYNLGDTVIHEVGHWFGLFHTFEGGCDSPGDYVADTAPEAEPSFACALTRDTCPSELPEGWVEGDPEPEPIVDPVQNFMDYSYDRCMNHFTPDQRQRALTLFMRYRAGR